MNRDCGTPPTDLTSCGPLTFVPFLMQRPWGGRRLETVLGRKLPAAGRFGESWELSGHPQHASCVADGPLQGRTLPDLWTEHCRRWGGPHQEAQFPWLLKYLDCHEFLSIQVHPDNNAARRLLTGETGKSEAWVVLSAEPGARIYAGLLPGVDRSEVERRLRNGTVAECLHSFEPRVGDCVDIPAGTVHSHGGGIVVAEIQQTSDATFRLFDWNRPGLDGRPRPLQIEQALQSINWSLGPVSPVTPQPLEVPHAAGVRGELLLNSEHFRWERFELNHASWTTPCDSLSVWNVIQGDVELSQEGYHRHCRLADTLLIPPSSVPCTWKSRSAVTLLRATSPICT